MLINPYDSKIGLHINTKGLEVELSEFLIKGDNTENLNYEYMMDGDIDIVFITGKNDDEQKLPIWHHPLFFKDFKGRDKIFVDVRPFVKVNKGDDVVSLDSIVSNRLGFSFMIIRVVYMVLLSIDKSALTGIGDNIAVAFGKWLTSSIKSSLSLDIVSAIKLEIVCMHYIYTLLADEEQNERTVENIYFKISKSVKAVKGNMKYIKETCEDIDINPKDAVDLAENIKKAVDSPLLRDMTSKMIYNIIGTTWNGTNPNENIGMSLEHIPTLIAIMITSVENKALKHSKLSNILNDNKRAVKTDDFVKTVNLTIKEQIV